MANTDCANCKDSNLNKNYSADSEKEFCQNCSEQNDKCVYKFDADCVIYNLNGVLASKLVNLNVPNNVSVSKILELVDAALGNSANTTLTPEAHTLKIKQSDVPGYLLDKIQGGTDGVVSISAVENSGKVQILPILNITALLEAIRSNATLRATIKYIVNLP